MMLDDYDLHELVLAEGSAHVQVPSHHPAFAELEKGRVKPVGGIRAQGWVYLFRIKDWNRLAAAQRAELRSSPSQRVVPVRVGATSGRTIEEPVGA